MEISHDETKRRKTLVYLDFADAPSAFAGFNLSRADQRFDYEEARFITVGLLNEAVVAMVWTDRDGSRRIISIRKADRTSEGTMTNSDRADPDDAPKLTSDWFAEADAYVGDTLVRRGRPKSDNAKRPVSLRLDRDVIDWFRQRGPGWQTRINEELRKVAGL